MDLFMHLENKETRHTALLVLISLSEMFSLSNFAFLNLVLIHGSAKSCLCSFQSKVISGLSNYPSTSTVTGGTSTMCSRYSWTCFPCFWYSLEPETARDSPCNPHPVILALSTSFYLMLMLQHEETAFVEIFLQKSFGEHFLIEVKTLYKISCFVQT
jgi:hypothetical protein